MMSGKLCLENARWGDSYDLLAARTARSTALDGSNVGRLVPILADTKRAIVASRYQKPHQYDDSFASNPAVIVSIFALGIAEHE